MNKEKIINFIQSKIIELDDYQKQQDDFESKQAIQAAKEFGKAFLKCIKRGDFDDN